MDWTGFPDLGWEWLVLYPLINFHLYTYKCMTLFGHLEREWLNMPGFQSNRYNNVLQYGEPFNDTEVLFKLHFTQLEGKTDKKKKKKKNHEEWINYTFSPKSFGLNIHCSGQWRCSIERDSVRLCYTTLLRKHALRATREQVLLTANIWESPI